MTTMHAPGPVRSRPVTSHPGQLPPARRRVPAVPRRAAFWLLALVLAHAGDHLVALIVATLLLFIAGPFVLWPLLRTPPEEE